MKSFLATWTRSANCMLAITWGKAWRLQGAGAAWGKEADGRQASLVLAAADLHGQHYSGWPLLVHPRDRAGSGRPRASMAAIRGRLVTARPGRAATRRVEAAAG